MRVYFDVQSFIDYDINSLDILSRLIVQPINNLIDNNNDNDNILLESIITNIIDSKYHEELIVMKGPNTDNYRRVYLTKGSDLCIADFIIKGDQILFKRVF